MFEHATSAPFLSYTTFSLATLLSLLAGLVFLAYRPQPSSKSPAITTQNWPIVGDLRFFTRRFDFFREAVASSKSGNFTFHVGKNQVVGVSGPKARQVFFESKQLSSSDGYAIIFGVTPNVGRIEDERGIMVDAFFIHFAKRLSSMLKRDNLSKLLPHLISDSRSLLDRLAASPRKTTNPFDSVYTLVYQLTMRTVGVQDVAEDPELLAKTLKMYETKETSSTTTTVIFPWLPTPAKAKCTMELGKLYMIFKAVADKRRATGERRDDPLQFLMDQGDTMVQILKFIISALFAGLLNSGINSAAILCYLATSPEWKAAVMDELRSVAAAHRPKGTEGTEGSSLEGSYDSMSLVDQLSALPIEAWEKEFPLLDACLRESIRLQMPGAALRRNTSGREIDLGGEVVPDGAFVAYHVTTTHLDPSIFPSPSTFDPSRFFPSRAEDKKQPHAYMGWGLGRHPCPGMKFAKLESNIIIALFLAKFDFELVDAEGKLTEMPDPDLNAWAAEKPKVPVYLKYWERE